eukprot:c18472_g1_i2.p1 GENE.c18472_g1_i2~~c18472_g1_i2.p1  ORF type:complete len:135 (+),score=7.81 c18472_g1_i2:34-438(+)
MRRKVDLRGLLVELGGACFIFCAICLFFSAIGLGTSSCGDSICSDPITKVNSRCIYCDHDGVLMCCANSCQSSITSTVSPGCFLLPRDTSAPIWVTASFGFLIMGLALCCTSTRFPVLDDQAEWGLREVEANEL